MTEEPETSLQGKGLLPPEGGRQRRGKNGRAPYPFELKRKAVKLYLEEQHSGRLIAEELGVSQQSLSGWVRVYRALGEADLKPYSRHTMPGVAKLPAPVTERILQLKREHPTFGVSVKAARRTQRFGKRNRVSHALAEDARELQTQIQRGVAGQNQGIQRAGFAKSFAEKLHFLANNCTRLHRPTFWEKRD